MIQDALTRAYELCAPYISDCNVNIYLLKGDHYVLRNYRQAYRPTALDTSSQNIKLIMQPYFCSIDSSHALCVEDDTKVTIYNKMRERFNLYVGAGLQLKYIIIDSLDSIVGNYSILLSNYYF